MGTNLTEIADWGDRYLRVAEIDDYPGAANGLQVENRVPIERVAVATDVSLATIEAAARAQCQLLMVHHGLFWESSVPITGRAYSRLSALMNANIALYSVHLPLDIHPEVGNNILLLKALGLELDGRFGRIHEVEGVGVWASPEMYRDEILERLERACGGKPFLIPGGPEQVHKVGIVTGGAGEMIGQAAAAGMDTFITGEGSHHTYHVAMELGLNVIYAGHYATETFGVKALAMKLVERFRLEWEFLDIPTGL
jgi:dinuclear metal center YbgI/SA1388 family protein